MLLSKYFVFVHFPRAGGTFIRKTLEKHMPTDSEMVLQPGHETVNDIPDIYQNILRFGFIRNPWDWYVSVYSGWRGMKKIRPDAFRGHKLDKIADGNSEIGFQTFLVRFLNKDQPSCDMSWVYNNIYGFTEKELDIDPPGLYIGRFENLREELLSFIQKSGMPISEALNKAISEDPPINNFKRRPYAEYYDDELRDLVYEHDRAIIDKYGYQF